MGRWEVSVGGPGKPPGLTINSAWGSHYPVEGLLWLGLFFLERLVPQRLSGMGWGEGWWKHGLADLGSTCSSQYAPPSLNLLICKTGIVHLTGRCGAVRGEDVTATLRCSAGWAVQSRCLASCCP